MAGHFRCTTVLILLLCSSSVIFPQILEPRCDSTSICPGENLLYEVSWMGISLGRIRIQTFPSVILNGEIVHRSSAIIDSYDGLPFVDVHAIDSTDMDAQLFSGSCRNYEKKHDGWFSEKLTVDPAHRFVIIEKYLTASLQSPPATPPEIDTIPLSGKPIQNGLSILFFAREEVRKTRRGLGRAEESSIREEGESSELVRSVSVPTVIYGKMGTTRFRFGSIPEYAEIDAFKDRKIRVMQFSGKAEFKGLFGLTGDFRGWCTDDNASIPIRAELQVLLGSVKVELIHCKRTGWKPPE